MLQNTNTHHLNYLGTDYYVHGDSEMRLIYNLRDFFGLPVVNSPTDDVSLVEVANFKIETGQLYLIDFAVESDVTKCPPINGIRPDGGAYWVRYDNLNMRLNFSGRLVFGDSPSLLNILNNDVLFSASCDFGEVKGVQNFSGHVVQARKEFNELKVQFPTDSKHRYKPKHQKALVAILNNLNELVYGSDIHNSHHLPIRTKSL